MVKQTISLSLEEETVTLLDKLSLIFSGNRSKFVDWLATRDFFLPTELVEKVKEVSCSIDDLYPKVNEAEK